MDTKILEYVIAIAEEKSLSKAAERLYLSQPALSQRLKKLEDELGTPLFLREKNGLSITDAGRIYINGAHSILQIKREALKKISSMSRSNKNTLRFACATSSAIECLPAFRELYPDIEILSQRCNSPKAKEDLIMGRADLGIVLTASLEHTVLEYLPLWTFYSLSRMVIRKSPRKRSMPVISKNSGMITLFSPTPPLLPVTVKNRSSARCSCSPTSSVRSRIMFPAAIC